MEFHGEIQNGKLILPPLQKNLMERFLSSLKSGTRLRLTLKREGDSKSASQVRAHFGLVVQMVRERLIEMGVDVCGVKPNATMVHDILKMACGGVGDDGETLGLSEMTVGQAAAFFENCRTWAATQLSLDIPEPDKNWRELLKG